MCKHNIIIEYVRTHLDLSLMSQADCSGLSLSTIKRMRAGKPIIHTTWFTYVEWLVKSSKLATALNPYYAADENRMFYDLTEPCRIFPIGWEVYFMHDRDTGCLIFEFQGDLMEVVVWDLVGMSRVGDADTQAYARTLGYFSQIEYVDDEYANDNADEDTSRFSA